MVKLNLIKTLTGMMLLSLLLLTSTARADTPPLNLSEYASRIVGAPTSVHCGDVPRGMYGYTKQIIETDSEGNSRTYFEPDIYLSRAVCSNIRLLYYHRILSYYWQANALETLVHESYHIRLNSGDEGVVECTAMLNLWNYLTPYGFSRAENKRFMAAAWDAHWSLGDEYLVGCPVEPEQTIIFGPIPKKKKNG